MRVQTERRHFHAKMTIAKLYIHIGVGARNLYIDEAHTALDILYSALRHFYVIILDIGRIDY